MSDQHVVTVGGGDIEVELLTAIGARLHRLRVGGHDLLRTPVDISEHVRDPFFWGGYVMAPWCGRLASGRTNVAGRVVDLRPNFPDGSAIHGQVYAASWRQVGDTSFGIDAGGSGGWPWRYRVEMAATVAATALSVVLRLTNLDDQPMPGGIGLHPWFPLPVDVAIHADKVYASNSDTSPSPQPVSGDLDLRHRQRMAEGVDATWPDPADPPLELFWPEKRLRATVRAPFPTLHIVAAYAAERGVIAAEPQTHAPQGLRRLRNREPGALTLIAPGETIELPITFEFSPLA
jgi:aldose 1-epimerase